MPLNSYGNTVRPASFGLIDDAFNRALQNNQVQTAPPTAAPGIHNAAGSTGPAAQVPNFFQNSQQPANQFQGSGQGNQVLGSGQGQGGAPLGGQGQGNLGYLGQLLALLGPLQSGAQGFLPGLFGGMEKPYYQKPQMLPGMLQNASQPYSGQGGAFSDPSIQALFSPQSYTAGWRAGGQGAGMQLQPNVQQAALDYILRTLTGGAGVGA